LSVGEGRGSRTSSTGHGSSPLVVAASLRYKKTMLPLLVTIFFSSFVIALSGALMPGPLLSVTIAESARRGALTGPAVIVGHALLELTVVLALFSGLEPLLLSDEFFISVAFVGGVLLLHMAVSMFRQLPVLSLQQDVLQGDGRNLVLAGIVLSAVNPYFILWWATVGFGYILYSAKFGLAGIVSFFLGHILADFCWYAAVSYGVCKGRNFLGDRGYRRICGGCALFLALFSCYFFYSGTERILG